MPGGTARHLGYPPAAAGVRDGGGANMTDKRVLWGVGSARALRVHWALIGLGLEYRSERIQSRSGETETPAYRRLNPRGKIPVLEDGGLERELPPGWKVWTDDSFDIAALFDLLETARPGNGRVEVVFPLDGDLEADMNLGVSVRLGRSLRLAVERLSGVTGVEELPDQEGLSHTV